MNKKNAPKGLISNVRIDKFGLFDKFNNETLEFKKKNLLYGWNYSGKTTLSRVFACFEKERLHEHYQDASFNIVLDDGNTKNEKDLTGVKVRVFNSEYISNNIFFEECGASPIFVLGEAAKEKKEELENQIKKLEAIERKNTNTSKKISKLKKEYESILSRKAKDIKEILSLTNFTTVHLKRYLDDMCNSTQDFLRDKVLSGDNKKIEKEQYFNSENKKDIPKLDVHLVNVNEIQKTLNKTVSPSRTISRLKNNSEAEEWARKGKQINKNNEICFFCGNKIPANLYSELDGHFSKDYEMFRFEVETLKNKIKRIDTTTFPQEDNFHKKYQTEYRENKNNLDKFILDYNTKIDKLIAVMENKLRNLTVSVEHSITFNFVDLTRELETMANLVRKNNEANNNVANIKENSKKKLIESMVCELILNIQYVLISKNVAKREKILKLRDRNKEILETVINELKQDLYSIHKGITKVNEVLKYYFGATTKIETRAEEDEEGNPCMKLYRGNILAKHLSEGEKTAIAFSHFVTNLENEDTPKQENLIIYIDDPISSLDSNHIYSTYSLIEHIAKNSKQIFISTHNYEFYNLFNSGKQGWERFYVSKEKEVCIIKQFPKVLGSFKSEYNYLFYLIYSFHKDEYKNNEQLYTLPNIMRRFLEMFTGFAVPNGSGIETRLKILTGKEIISRKIAKILHSASHSQPFPIGFRNVTEAKEAAVCILNIVKDHNPTHFNCLKCIAVNPNMRCSDKEKESCENKNNPAVTVF